MIDHMTLSVRDFKAARKFYEATLKPLGYSVKREYPNLAGFGDTRPYFWVKQSKVPTTPQHIAFVAKDRAAVRAFHKAALKAGGKDDGAPGPREIYHPHYYGAFVVDPEGHPIEAVCHAPARKKR